MVYRSENWSYFLSTCVMVLYNESRLFLLQVISLRFVIGSLEDFIIFLFFSVYHFASSELSKISFAAAFNAVEHTFPESRSSEVVLILFLTLCFSLWFHGIRRWLLLLRSCRPMSCSQCCVIFHTIYCLLFWFSTVLYSLIIVFLLIYFLSFRIFNVPNAIQFCLFSLLPCLTAIPKLVCLTSFGFLIALKNEKVEMQHESIILYCVDCELRRVYDFQLSSCLLPHVHVYG